MCAKCKFNALLMAPKMQHKKTSIAALKEKLIKVWKFSLPNNNTIKKQLRK